MLGPGLEHLLGGVEHGDHLVQLRLLLHHGEPLLSLHHQSLHTHGLVLELPPPVTSELGSDHKLVVCLGAGLGTTNTNNVLRRAGDKTAGQLWLLGVTDKPVKARILILDWQ